MNDEIVIYKSEDGVIKLDVLFSDETVWLTQSQMSQLFQRDVSVISRHLNNIFEEHELDENTNLHFLQIANSDKPVKCYSLDALNLPLPRSLDIASIAKSSASILKGAFLAFIPFRL